MHGKSAFCYLINNATTSNEIKTYSVDFYNDISKMKKIILIEALSVVKSTFKNIC